MDISFLGLYVVQLPDRQSLQLKSMHDQPSSNTQFSSVDGFGTNTTPRLYNTQGVYLLASKERWMLYTSAGCLRAVREK